MPSLLLHQGFDLVNRTHGFWQEHTLAHTLPDTGTATASSALPCLHGQDGDQRGAEVEMAPWMQGVQTAKPSLKPIRGEVADSLLKLGSIALGTVLN